MGRGPGRRDDDLQHSQSGLRGVSEEGRLRISRAHFDEHRHNLLGALRETREAFGNQIGSSDREINKSLVQAGLVGLAAGAGAATISPALAVLAPAAGAALGWRAYNSWNTANLWRNSALGRALAKNFGTDVASGRINSIVGTLAKRGLAGLAGAGASSIALGTPIAPVALAAVGGYAAYKAARVLMDRRKMKREEEAAGADPSVAPEATPTPEAAPEATPTPEAAPEATPTPEAAPEAAPSPAVAEAVAEESGESEADTLTPEEYLERRVSDVAARRAEQAASEGMLAFEERVASELGQVARAEGRDFADGLDPEAQEARSLMYLANSRWVPEDESGDAVRDLVAKLEAQHYASSPEGKARLKEIDSELKQIQKEEEALRKRYQELDAAAQALGEGDEALIHLAQMQKMEAEEKFRQAKMRALDLHVERESLHSPQMGRVEGLANLVASGRELRCARCGTAPRTVRVACSKCGMPFVVSSENARFVGIGEEGLRKTSKWGLVEKYEGDAETRASRWAMRADGKFLYHLPDGESGSVSSSGKTAGSKKKSGGSSAKGGGSSKSPSKKKSTGGSSSPNNVSLGDTIRKGLDGPREDYIAMRNKAREASGSQMILSGLKRFGDDQVSRMTTPKDQASCVVDGEFPMDFGVSSKNGDHRNINVGDRVLIRQAGGEDYNEKNSTRLLGYADVRKTVHHDFTEEEMSDPDAARQKLGEIWDENNLGEIQSIFTKDEFIDYNAEDVLNGRSKFSLILYENEQRFDQPIEPEPGWKESAMNSQGAGKRLREGYSDYQKIIDATYAQDHEMGLDKNGKPVVCGVRTAAGSACRNYVSRGSKYCWQHRGGPGKGESALSKDEIQASQAETLERMHSSPAGAANGSSDIVSVVQKEEEPSFAAVDNPKLQEFLDSQPHDPATSKTLPTCGMTERELAHYANAILDGINPGPDDTVIIEPTKADHLDLADMMVKVSRLRKQGNIAIWRPDEGSSEERKDVIRKNGSNMIFTALYSVGEENSLDNTATKYIGLINEGELRWNMTFLPTQEWADRLATNPDTGFGDCENPLRQLAQDLQSFSYTDKEGGLRAHIEELDKRAERMEKVRREREVESLQITGEGTDLSLALTETTKWSSVDMPFSNDSPDKALANTATEEIFATPLAKSLEGSFQSSRMVSLDGSGNDVLEGVRGEFRDGELVELKAIKQNKSGEWVEDREGQAKLANFFETSTEGPWPQCGEVGLLDSKGRVAQTGRNYLHATIDEHGGLHIAIGTSYAANGGGEENGASPSSGMGHLDIPIGGSSSSVIGHTKSGDKISFIENDEWQDF